MVRDVRYPYSIYGKIRAYANVFYFCARVSSSLPWLPACVASQNAVRAVGGAPLTFIHESAGAVGAAAAAVIAARAASLLLALEFWQNNRSFFCEFLINPDVDVETEYIAK